jgi:hypothetical protein
MKRSALIWILTVLIHTALNGQKQDIQPDLSQFSISIPDGIISQIPIDTTITGSQISSPIYGKFPGWSELGNNGLPAVPLRYEGPSETYVPYFLTPYLNYATSDASISFYDTKTPFSQVNYTGEVTGDKNKVSQKLNFFYSRNLGPDMNITGYFDFISSNGDYTNQASTHSVIGFKLAVNKERYRHYSEFQRIQFKIQENGGVVNDEDVITSTGRFASLVDVNLDNASSKTSIMRIFGRQYIDFLSIKTDLPDSTGFKKERRFKPVLIHKYNFSSAKRLYNDSPLSMDFYKDTLISGELTQDSVHSYSFVNDVNLRFEIGLADSLNWTLEAGLHHELLHMYSFENSQWAQGIGLDGFTAIDLKKMRLTALGRIILAGYEAGDHRLEINAGLMKFGNFSGPVIKASTKAYSPDLFINSYSSNHFRWDNQFKKQIEQSAGLSWNVPKIKLGLDLRAGLISNWIYINQNAMPSQRDGTATVLNGIVSKDFKAGPFRSRNELSMNYTNAEEIPLPLLVALTSTFMHHDIYFQKTGGLLQLEYGFDIRYASAYKGYAYMPATGLFYLQNERMLGNYPFVDLFIMMRVKRTRFYVKWNHVNSGFTGSNIFPVLHYPVKERKIEYGVYWHFYD